MNTLTKQVVLPSYYDLGRIIFDGKKSRNTLVGKQVIATRTDINNLIQIGESYIIKEVRAGNYDAFLVLEGFPETRVSKFNGLVTPVSFDYKWFVLQ